MSVSKYIFTKEQEQEIIDFYLVPNSLKETAVHFDISTNKVYSLLKKYSIHKHSKETWVSLRNEKSKQTNLLKYGCENPMQNKLIQEKTKQTCIKKYGVDNPHKAKKVKEKTKETNIKRYGGCAPQCSHEVVEKTKQTNLSRYGYKSVGQVPEFREKIKNTNLKKYGVDSYTKTDEFKEKCKNTCLKKYGVEYITQLEEIKEKIKQTNLERYGVENPSSAIEIQNKRKNTNLERYGVECTWNNPETQEKRKQTMLDRYNTIYPAQIPEVKEKIKATNLKKYGYEYYSQTEDYKNGLFEKYGTYHAPIKRYFYNNKYLDSFPELCLYIYCLENNIPIIREPIELIFEFEGKSYHYYPDFKINEELIEIKGSQFLTENGNWHNPYDHTLDELFEAKHRCALENNVKILYNQDYQKYIDRFNENGYRKEDYLIKNIV